MNSFEVFLAGTSRVFYFALSAIFLFVSITMFIEGSTDVVWAWGALAVSVALFLIPLFASDKTMIDGGPNP